MAFGIPTAFYYAAGLHYPVRGTLYLFFKPDFVFGVFNCQKLFIYLFFNNPKCLTTKLEKVTKTMDKYIVMIL